jgi:hypothetical protein
VFIPNGVQIVGLVAPADIIRGNFRTAREHFGRQELLNALKWNANTIRFQVSQPGLDPQSPLYSQQYLADLKRGVQMARDLGFVVIVSVQDQHGASGDSITHKMPTEATRRALHTLCSAFNSDGGVIYELFNEPALRPSPDNWRLWKSGGIDPDGGDQIIGMQALIHDVRGTGSHNLLIVEGLLWGGTFEGAPQIFDPDAKTVYGVHPYFGHSGFTPDGWNKTFGFLAVESKPVICTEWCQPTPKQGQPTPPWFRGLSGKQLSHTPLMLLHYLEERGIGIIGWAFDIPGTIVQDLDGTPTSFEAGNQPGGGPGACLRAYFKRVNQPLPTK